MLFVFVTEKYAKLTINRVCHFLKIFPETRDFPYVVHICTFIKVAGIWVHIDTMFAFFSIPSLLFEKKGHGGATRDRNSEHFKSCAINGSKKSVSLLYVHLETVFSHFNGFWSGLYKGFFGVQDCRKISLLGWSVALWFVLSVRIICRLVSD